MSHVDYIFDCMNLCAVWASKNVSDCEEKGVGTWHLFECTSRDVEVNHRVPSSLT